MTAAGRSAGRPLSSYSRRTADSFSGSQQSP